MSTTPYDQDHKRRFETMYDSESFEVPLTRDEYIYRASTYINLEVRLNIEDSTALAIFWYTKYKSERP